jgi:hypothetical protein
MGRAVRRSDRQGGDSHTGGRSNQRRERDPCTCFRPGRGDCGKQAFVSATDLV